MTRNKRWLCGHYNNTNIEESHSLNCVLMEENLVKKWFVRTDHDVHGMDNHSALTVLPSHDELSSICNGLKCSEKNCNSVFKCSSNLNMHLVKHHKISDGLKRAGMNIQYACPIESCKYGLKSSKHFSKKKYLKQHYLKCHAKKEHTCSLCSKGFPTKSMQVAHEKTCGVKFSCVCGWTYTSKEALMTHCKRKQHIPAESNHLDSKTQQKRDLNSALLKQDFVDTGAKIHDGKILCSCGSKDFGKTQCKKKSTNHPEDESPCVDPNISEMKSESENKGEENTVVKVCIASPPHAKSPRKPSNDFTVFPTHYIAAIALSELSTTFIIPKNCHIGVQTVDTKVGKKTRSPGSDKKRKNSQETQTAGTASKSKRQKISAETQTVSHVKQKTLAKNIPRRRKKSTETQTKDPMPFLSSVGSESLDGGIFNESSLSNSSVTTESNQKREIPSSMDYESVWDNQSFNHKLGQQSKSFITTLNNSMFNLNNELTIDTRGGNIPLSHFTNFDKLCNNETQTEIENLLQTDGEGTSTIETQTSDDLFEDLLYSNMCTQTCDDVGELFDFNFVDIETQTAWPAL